MKARGGCISEEAVAYGLIGLCLAAVVLEAIGATLLGW